MIDCFEQRCTQYTLNTQQKAYRLALLWKQWSLHQPVSIVVTPYNHNACIVSLLEDAKLLEMA